MKKAFYLIILLIIIFNFKVFSLASENLKNTRFDIISTVSSSSGSISVGSESNLDLEIIGSPIFPDIVKLPTMADLSIKKTGYAFPASNPTFEILLKTQPNNIEIKRIDIEDSNSTNHTTIPFKMQTVKNSQDSILLTLTIPDEISIGTSKLSIRTVEGSILRGEFEIIDFLSVRSRNNSQDIGEPIISMVGIESSESNLSLMIHGRNFAPKNIFYSNDGFSNNNKKSFNAENTKITLFPSSISFSNSEIEIQKGFSLINALLNISNPNQETNIVLVITTPRGIVSKSLDISP